MSLKLDAFASSEKTILPSCDPGVRRNREGLIDRPLFSSLGRPHANTRLVSFLRAARQAVYLVLPTVESSPPSFNTRKIQSIHQSKQMQTPPPNPGDVKTREQTTPLAPAPPATATTSLTKLPLYSQKQKKAVPLFPAPCHKGSALDSPQSRLVRIVP